MNGDEPVPAWTKVGAALIACLTVACLVVFRHRLGVDFWPVDASRVGPNLIASLIQWAVIFVLAILIWPPWRRRLHRFVDAKIAPLHEKVDELHAHHQRHAADLEAIKEHLGIKD